MAARAAIVAPYRRSDRSMTSERIRVVLAVGRWVIFSPARMNVLHVARGDGVESGFEGACARGGGGLNTSGRDARKPQGVGEEGGKVRIADELLDVHDTCVKGIDTV